MTGRSAEAQRAAARRTQARGDSNLGKGSRWPPRSPIYLLGTAVARRLMLFLPRGPGHDAWGVAAVGAGDRRPGTLGLAAAPVRAGVGGGPPPGPRGLPPPLRRPR